MTRAAALLAACTFALVAGACTGDQDGASPTGSSPAQATTLPEADGTGSPPTSSVRDEPSATTVEPAVTSPATTVTGSAAPSTSVVITGDDGTMRIGVDELPTGLDPAFPIPDDLTIDLSSETDGDLAFTGVTDRPFDETVELFRSGLVAAGYVITDETRTDGLFAVMRFVGPPGSGEVAVSAGPGGHTDVVVGYVPA